MIGHAQPLIVVLENVRGFLSVEQGGYFDWLRGQLRAIGYARFEWKVLATHHFGLPQQRVRLYMVALRDDVVTAGSFRFPVGDVTRTPALSTFLRKRLAKKYANTIRCGWASPNQVVNVCVTPPPPLAYRPLWGSPNVAGVAPRINTPGIACHVSRAVGIGSP